MARLRGKYYQGRVFYTDPYTNEKKELSQGGFKTKGEAEKWETEQKYKLDKGHEVAKTSLSLVDYLYQWLEEYKKGNVRPNTYHKHLQVIKVQVEPYFQKIKLKEVDHMKYQKFINDLNEKGYSQATMEKIHSTMFGAFNIAVKPLRYIAINPADGVIIPKNTKAKKEGEKYNYLESDDIKLFLTTARKDNYLYYMFFKTAIFTGMRKGEIAGLGWQDIDFEDGSIDVNKTLHHQLNEGQDRIGPPKTEKAYRKVKVDKKLLEELKDLKKIADQNKEIYGEEYEYYEDLQKQKYNLVFCKENGEFIPKSTLFNALNRVLEKAKLSSRRICIHDLRDTHTVMCLEAGMPLEEVAERLGHEDISTTNKFYIHITNKMKNTSIEKLENYMSELLDE
jgi:integrase